MYQLRTYLVAEIDVCTVIKEKMLVQNKQQADKLRKFATMLRVPRLHFEYIEKHGFNEFVDYCEDIVRRERALNDVNAADKQRVEMRNRWSITKLRKQNQPISEKIER